MQNPQYPWDEEDRLISIPESDKMYEKYTSLSPTSISDTFINAVVFLPRGNSDIISKVIRRSLGLNW